MTVAEYARWFRDHAAWLSPENREVGEFVVEHEAQLTQWVRNWSRGRSRWAIEDLTQTAMNTVVEGVRESQAGRLNGTAGVSLELMRAIKNSVQKAARTFSKHQTRELTELPLENIYPNQERE